MGVKERLRWPGSDKREGFYDRLDASTKDQAGLCVKGSMIARTSEARLRCHRSQWLRLYGGSYVRDP